MLKWNLNSKEQEEFAYIVYFIDDFFFILSFSPLGILSLQLQQSYKRSMTKHDETNIVNIIYPNLPCIFFDDLKDFVAAKGK